jgi:hypothetical protein
MPSYTFLEITSWLCLVIWASLFLWEREPKSAPWVAVWEWAFRIGLLGFLGIQILEIIIYPKQWGESMQGLLDSI